MWPVFVFLKEIYIYIYIYIYIWLYMCLCVCEYKNKKNKIFSGFLYVVRFISIFHVHTHTHTHTHIYIYIIYIYIYIAIRSLIWCITLIEIKFQHSKVTAHSKACRIWGGANITQIFFLPPKRYSHFADIVTLFSPLRMMIHDRLVVRPSMSTDVIRDEESRWLGVAFLVHLSAYD